MKSLVKIKPKIEFNQNWTRSEFENCLSIFRNQVFIKLVPISFKFWFFKEWFENPEAYILNTMIGIELFNFGIDFYVDFTFCEKKDWQKIKDEFCEQMLVAR